MSVRDNTEGRDSLFVSLRLLVRFPGYSNDKDFPNDYILRENANNAFQSLRGFRYFLKAYTSSEDALSSKRRGLELTKYISMHSNKYKPFDENDRQFPIYGIDGIDNASMNVIASTLGNSNQDNYHKKMATKLNSEKYKNAFQMIDDETKKNVGFEVIVVRTMLNDILDIVFYGNYNKYMDEEQNALSLILAASTFMQNVGIVKYSEKKYYKKSNIKSDNYNEFMAYYFVPMEGNTMDPLCYYRITKPVFTNEDFTTGYDPLVKLFKGRIGDAFNMYSVCFGFQESEKKNVLAITKKYIDGNPTFMSDIGRMLQIFESYDNNRDQQLQNDIEKKIAVENKKEWDMLLKTGGPIIKLIENKDAFPSGNKFFFKAVLVTGLEDFNSQMGLIKDIMEMYRNISEEKTLISALMYAFRVYSRVRQ